MLTMIAQHLAPERLGQIVDIVRFTLAMGVTKTYHLFTEAGMVAAARINKDHFTMPPGMLVNKSGQQFDMTALIQQVAAYDEIKLS